MDIVDIKKIFIVNVLLYIDIIMSTLYEYIYILIGGHKVDMIQGTYILSTYYDFNVHFFYILFFL